MMEVRPEDRLGKGVQVSRFEIQGQIVVIGSNDANVLTTFTSPDLSPGRRARYALAIETGFHLVVGRAFLLRSSLQAYLGCSNPDESGDCDTFCSKFSTAPVAKLLGTLRAFTHFQ